MHLQIINLGSKRIILNIMTFCIIMPKGRENTLSLTKYNILANSNPYCQFGRMSINVSIKIFQGV